MPVEKGKGKGKGKGKAAKRANTDANAAALKDFAVEYSKSSRATCRVCEIKICKVCVLSNHYWFLKRSALSRLKLRESLFLCLAIHL